MRPLARRNLLATVAAISALLATSTPAHASQVPAFGDDFYWGVAASGFQSEGHAPDSNWTRYIATHPDYDRYGDSVDFYSRYASDIALAEQLGVNVYRIGIEWARVQPRPGVWDPNGFAFYDKVIAAIRGAGMRPMLTLDHWVYPGWAADRGGWRNAGMVEDWLTNMRAVVDRYAAADPLWVTINEPAAYMMNEVRNGGLPIGEIPVMQQRLADAHNSIYDYIHAVQPGAMVTSNVAYIPAADQAVNGAMLSLIANRLDYIGIDYYYGMSPATVAQYTSFAQNALWKLPLEADGIYYTLRHFARQFPGKPLYIVENGMPTENGAPRADGYTRADDLRDTIYWIQRARADGMNVMGYNYWSLTDNYEWGSYTPRFGLYTVDVRSDPALTRRPTDAVDAYRLITRDGGVPAHYLPTRVPATCSLVDAPSSCTDPVTLPR
ncbi:family 1 glycosylhydrolase [Nocardia huaxiensis]|uniref:Glycoside hydrolase family 1 protein n=1 Tax=Nocardia huaxiensis TaxID=2755382 RepID=A0A7D6ZDS8_9NOCA|nr:family 1 glycosylhydrolase [Nocardia huaxiensis]QLY28499.1 glycoside hydrolase family 1 protein [Nocardia huaxiensis]UFS98048.1 family 1 glycosylhydrolase [Nocardia huaxiensis]